MSRTVHTELTNMCMIYDQEGNVIGGLVINSNINYNLPSSVTDYHLPLKVEQCPFLKHNSFVNCSKIIVASKTKFTKKAYRGEISDSETRLPSHVS